MVVTWWIAFFAQWYLELQAFDNWNKFILVKYTLYRVIKCVEQVSDTAWILWVSGND